MASQGAYVAEMTNLDSVGAAPTGAGVAAGVVSIVGAGPGAADLITVRGLRALEAADVVVFDRLVEAEVLDLAPTSALRVPVGKGKGFGVAQEEIAQLLVFHARSGRHVVRLKGGDPFVFGRGLEEVEALDAAGLEHDVVPGLSSALAGPALAGISLTDRRYAASFTVLSGHRADDESYDWSSVARSADTLVVLMAASTAAAVCRCLLAAGRPADDRVAMISSAGRLEQLVHRGRLDEVALDGSPFLSPMTMVIGAAAAAHAVIGVREGWDVRVDG